ncbi:ASC1-like protein [Musa troglodytarum]|uniref:ASC1-like protein n=1 Tax=Musa troglodytarum TaxID=320322 RepID=A0A9E7L2B6_9LILI|nr:ASC1-like protein [Musa troglodytarum]
MDLVTAWRSVDWEQEGYPTYEDFVALPFLALFFPTVRFFLDRFVFEPWLTNTRYFWVGPGNQVWPDQKIKLKLKFVYMYVAGFYSYSIFAIMFWETRRSDFGVSMSHHMATVILIVLSYIFRFARVGSVVLAIHDASDVFLEMGKMSNYEVLLTLDKEKHKFEGPIYYYVFNTLLFSLLVLHIYWWILMFRMLVKQIQSGQVGDDVRSDSEDEEQHED